MILPELLSSYPYLPLGLEQTPEVLAAQAHVAAK